MYDKGKVLVNSWTSGPCVLFCDETATSRSAKIGAMSHQYQMTSASDCLAVSSLDVTYKRHLFHIRLRSAGPRQTLITYDNMTKLWELQKPSESFCWLPGRRWSCAPTARHRKSENKWVQHRVIKYKASQCLFPK
jgi:hypothetical protein